MNNLLEWIEYHIDSTTKCQNFEARTAFILTKHYVNALIKRQDSGQAPCLHMWAKEHPLTEELQKYVCLICYNSKTEDNTNINEQERSHYDAYRDA